MLCNPNMVVCNVNNDDDENDNIKLLFHIFTCNMNLLSRVMDEISLSFLTVILR